MNPYCNTFGTQYQLLYTGGSNSIITKAGITGPFSTNITSPPRSESVRYLWLRTCVHGMVQNVPNDVHEGVTKSLRDFTTKLVFVVTSSNCIPTIEVTVNKLCSYKQH